MRLPLLVICTLLGLGACKDDATDDSGALDMDGDGFAAGEDCDDADSAVHPDAAELCDAVDNNCDGLIDADATDAPTWYIDYDGDGYGGDAFTLVQCEQPEGYLASAEDCDDTTALTSPAAAEDCVDGLDNNCDALQDCDDSTCGGDDACAPTLTAVDPPYGAVDSATPVTIHGAGFAYQTAGAPLVYVGGQAATDVVVVDDNTLTASFPGGTAGSADVEVVNNNGSALLPAGWIWAGGFIFAATGKAGQAGPLVAVDPASGFTLELGDLPMGVTGLASSPDGVLYATESSGGSGGSLWVVEPWTASATEVGELVDADGEAHDNIADITFVGTRLLGWSEDGDVPVEIDPTTGLVTVLGAQHSSAGDGFAYDSATGLIWFMNYDAIYQVDPGTGSTTATGISYSGMTYGRVNAATFHLGALYVTDALSYGDGTLLSWIDTSTGAVTSVATLPGYVDAIASTTP